MKGKKIIVLSLVLGLLTLSTTGCDKGSNMESDSRSFAGSGSAVLRDMNNTTDSNTEGISSLTEKDRTNTAGVMSILSKDTYSFSALINSERLSIKRNLERWSISGTAIPVKYREQGVERVVQVFDTQYCISDSLNRMVEVPTDKRIEFPNIVKNLIKDWDNLEYIEKSVNTFKNSPYDCEVFKNTKTGKIARFFYVGESIKGYQEEGSEDYIEFLLVSPLFSDSDASVSFSYNSFDINFD